MITLHYTPINHLNLQEHKEGIIDSLDGVRSCTYEITYLITFAVEGYWRVYQHQILVQDMWPTA